MTLFALILSLIGCPTAEEPADACPTGVILTDADLPCECAGETADALPGCGEITCESGGIEVMDLGCDSGGGGCKGLDCG